MGTGLPPGLLLKTTIRTLEFLRTASLRTASLRTAWQRTPPPGLTATRPQRHFTVAIREATVRIACITTLATGTVDRSNPSSPCGTAVITGPTPGCFPSVIAAIAALRPRSSWIPSRRVSTRTSSRRAASPWISAAWWTGRAAFKTGAHGIDGYDRADSVSSRRSKSSASLAGL